MKKVILFICFILFTSEVYSGGHRESKYGPKPKIKFHGLVNAECSKLGVCDFSYANEEVRQRAKDLNLSSRKMRVRISEFEPQALRRFSKCYQNDDWVNNMWAEISDGIESAERASVIGRLFNKGMRGQIYFGQKESTISIMKKYRRNNRCEKI